MEAHTKIALAGGGGENDSRLLDEVFASWVGPGGRLLYWPIALRGQSPFQTCFDWITSVFLPLGISNITMWTDLSEHQASELEEFDGVYIGGGNTYSLLAQLHESGFDRSLKAYLAEGKAAYGGSAGAAVLGRDIQTVSHLDRNGIGLEETSALDLVDGSDIWVHYQPGEDTRIEEYARKYRRRVLAISERSGIAIESAEIRSVGFEPAYRFDGTTKSEVRGGS